jgi:hypothetical protein
MRTPCSTYHFGDASKAGTDSSATGANAEGAPRSRSGLAHRKRTARVFGQSAIKATAPPLLNGLPVRR